MTISFTHPIYLWALLFIPLAWLLAFLAPRALTTLRRRLSLVLRTLVLGLVIFALAGAQVRRVVDNLTVVFLVDVSDSMPVEARQEASAYVRAATSQMPEGDRAAVVLFGKEALVERTASELRLLGPLASVPVATRTNIADAIQLGLALFPADMQKRLLLLSDGQQNEGDARLAAEVVAAREVVLDSVMLGGDVAGAEVQVTALEAPDSVALGQRFELVVNLLANQDTTVQLRIFGDNQLIYDQAVEVPAGGTLYRIPLEAQEEGFQRYRAVIEGATGGDMRTQNNEAAAFTQVTGPPLVAIVTTQPEETTALEEALRGSEMGVERFFPNALPQTLEGLIRFDSIVLVGVESADIPPATMELLPTFVRDVGHGLVMIGGPSGFGAGQWFRTPVQDVLPVDMEVMPKDQQSNVALVLALDKSGSMSSGSDEPSSRPSALTKVDIAKNAVMQATAALGNSDLVGIVAFDSGARWALSVQPYPNSIVLEEAIGSIVADGGTDIFAGLKLAEEGLRGAEAKIKHIILLTDGHSNDGDHQALAARFADEGITLSVVAAGIDSAPDLVWLAEQGGGRYYPAVAIEDVPQIFLKETIRIAGRYIIEEPFYPTLINPSSSILAGFAPNTAFPLLVGHNGTTLKADATEIMRTPQGYPLLATRRYGIGRTVAWTSDLSARWAGEWLAWGGFSDFAAQLVAWSFPDPETGNLVVRTRQQGSDTFIDINASDEEGRPISADTQAIIVAPDSSTSELTVPQVGAGAYQIELPSDAVGAYFVTVSQRDENGEPLASNTRGLVVPYSPEYRLQEGDQTLLTQISEQTKGKLRFLSEPATAFEQPFQPVSRTQALWNWLIALALLLFPFDIATRRLMLGQREVEGARIWLMTRLSSQTGQAQAPQERILGSLLQAKERATRRERGASPSTSPPSAGSPSAGSPSAGSGTVEPKVEPPPVKADVAKSSQSDSEESDTLSQLRRAKARRRRR